MSNDEKVTLRDIYESVTELRREISETYATKEEVKPLKQIIFGGVGLALVALLTAVLSTVVKASSL